MDNISDGLLCPKCQMISPYHVVIDGIHHSAYCNVCGTFIKYIPQSNKRYTLYFGRYKGVDIQTIDDWRYLEWTLELPNINSKVKEQINKRLYDLIAMGKV